MTDRTTIGIYDARAREYADKNAAHNASDPRLAAFVDAMPDGGHVLDLGCGPGQSAAVMARAGLKVDAIDASAEMVRLTSAVPGVKARQGTFDDIAGSALYDGVWASFSLLHAPRPALPGHLGALHMALKPGGMLYIALKLGTGEARDKLGRLYTYYSAPELEALVTDAGFNIAQRHFGAGEGLDGTSSDWICLTAHA